MNVYDFDKTIYDGDSTIDFYLFCLRKKPVLFRYIFTQCWGLFLYAIKKCDKTAFKERFHAFLKGIDDIDGYVCDFWKSYLHKIKPWYKEKQQNNDLIISASAEFLLESVVQNLIASRVDKATGIYISKNCYGEEKVRMFFEKYPDGIIDEFYSDSKSDYPLAKISKKSYLVKKNFIEEWKI